ncbi:MAG TPA: UvrD-helicase domain-containing protein, partial [bacterium]|nr:UvrD-helicase domain-containing protein [bacterium]
MNQEAALEIQTPGWMSELNPSQRLAVLHSGGPLLVLAGAGSGKTRVITYRIAYLIEACGASPWNILAVTFTNKAAHEMKERVVSLLGERAEAVLVSTFHSLCARMLRRDAVSLGISPEFTIYDETDSLSVVQQAKAQVAGECALKPQRIRAKISAAKSEMMTPEDLAQSLDKDYVEGQQLARIFAAYEEILRANQAMDFDDLLLVTIRLLTEVSDVRDRYQRRFRHVLVDEYQDTNSAQYKILKLLTGGSSKPDLCVVGDDDQSIYRWRGARLNNILDFEKDFPGTRVVRLEENYRSTQTILNASNAMVAHNQKRKGKTLWTRNVQGAALQLLSGDDEQQEAAQVVETILRERQSRGTGTGIAVFYRTNSQSRALEETLIQWRV